MTAQRPFERVSRQKLAREGLNQNENVLRFRWRLLCVLTNTKNLRVLEFKMNSGRLIGVRLGLRRLSLAHGSIEPKEAERAERVLATARVLFAVAAFVAISIDPTEPTRYYFLAYTLLLTYVLYSLGVLIVLTVPRNVSQGSAYVLWI